MFCSALPCSALPDTECVPGLGARNMFKELISGNGFCASKFIKTSPLILVEVSVKYLDR